jgi:hypothetical protein
MSTMTRGSIKLFLRAYLVELLGAFLGLLLLLWVLIQVFHVHGARFNNWADALIFALGFSVVNFARKQWERRRSG